MNLKYDMRTAYQGDAKEHPIRRMRNLGITYSISEPQTLGDCWFFYGCVNVPDPLPPYLTKINRQIPPPPDGYTWLQIYDLWCSVNPSDNHRLHQLEQIVSMTFTQVEQYAFAELLAARPTKAEVLDIMTIVYEPKKVSHTEYETGKNVIKKLQAIAIVQ